MAKHEKPKVKAVVKAAPKIKISKKMAETPVPKRGDPQIGKKRQKEARSAAIGRGILKQM